jgi:hypothetical protein
MPIAKLRQDYTPTPSAAPAAQPSTEPETFEAAPSPVLALQQQLSQRAVAAPATDVDKWSPRRSLALIVSASVALWMAILMGGAELTKLIA